MANIFWMKQEIDYWTRAMESMKGLLRRLKISWTLVYKRVKIEPEFPLTLSKFSVQLRCQALHTANGTQPNFTKGEEVNDADASRIR